MIDMTGIKTALYWLHSQTDLEHVIWDLPLDELTLQLCKAEARTLPNQAMYRNTLYTLKRVRHLQRAERICTNLHRAAGRYPALQRAVSDLMAEIQGAIRDARSTA